MENPNLEIKDVEVVDEKWLRRIMQKRLSVTTWNYFFKSWTFVFIPFLGFGLSTLGLRYFNQYPLMHIFLVSIVVSAIVWWILYLVLQNWIYNQSNSVRTAKVQYLQYYITNAKEERARYKTWKNFIMAGRVGRCVDKAESMMKILEKESISTLSKMDTKPLGPVKDEHDPWYIPQRQSPKEITDGSSKNDQEAVPSTQ